MNKIRPSRFAWALLLLGAALVTTTTLAADKAGLADAQARYERERALCKSGASNQDRATCLKEAGAAFAEAKRDGLNDGPAPQYVQNASLRCKGFRDDDQRAACMARMQGQGSTSGSVSAGGISREHVTREAVLPGGGAKDAPAK